MIGNIKKDLKCEYGAVQIVESVFVFPVMFIILFFLIFMGNAFYVKAQVESVVEKNAIRGANYCADPLLATMLEYDHLPSLANLKTEPYRYIFGGMDDEERKINEAVQNEINGNSNSFFKSMKPQLVGSSSKISKFNNYVVYSTFSVEVKYKLRFPIRFLGRSSPTVMTITSRSEVPVDDTAEFIRNTDMVIDLFHNNKYAQKISDVFGKINDFLSNFAKK